MLEDVVTAKKKKKSKLNEHYADNSGLKLFSLSFFLSLSLFLALGAVAGAEASLRQIVIMFLRQATNINNIKASSSSFSL